MIDIKKFIDDYVQAKATIRKELQEHGKEYVRSMVEDIMSRYPEINGLCWRGYAPYFNDGDACEFSIRGPAIHGEPIETDEDDLERSQSSDYFVKTWGEEAPYESTIDNPYWTGWNWKWADGKNTRTWVGNPDLEEMALKIKEIETNVSLEINDKEDILQMALGDPHEVRAWREDGKLHIEISFEVDHD